MNILCPICKEEFDNESHPYKKHKIKCADFLNKYYPKRDLYTSASLRYRGSIESYFLTDFSDRINLKKYLETNNKQIGYEYCINTLKTRKEIKKISYAPGEFEIKSLTFPSVVFIEKFFGRGKYKEMVNHSGLKIRYNYDKALVFNTNEPNIVVDTREQNPLNFDNMIVLGLSYGDYTDSDGKHNIYIERKSLCDFLGTMSQGFDRFKNELDRCKKDNAYLIVLIEEKYSNLTSYPYLPHTKKVQAKPIFIAHRFRELLNNYPLNCQMLAVDGRKEAKRVISKIFQCQQNIRGIDLQYYYNKKEL